MKLWEKVAGGLLTATGVAAIGYEIWDSLREKPKAMLPALPTTKKAFIKQMRDAIGTQIPDDGAKRLAIGWAAFEADWGRTTGFIKANNPWNITAGSSWTGDTVPGPDTEYDAHGNVTKITQSWRKYNTLSDAVGDLFTFLTIGNGGKYLAGRDLLLKGDPGFVHAIQQGGYFTLPLDKYENGVATCLADVNNYWDTI